MNDRFISPERLLTIYRTFQEEPNRVFILKDFMFSNRFGRNYLMTLVHLKLIEEVEVVYHVGNTKNRKGTIGYKLKKEVSK
jgi:hypothetical protein